MNIRDVGKMVFGGIAIAGMAWLFLGFVGVAEGSTDDLSNSFRWAVGKVLEAH